MLNKHREFRMMWLMLLIVVAISAWLADVPSLTVLCGIAFVMSLMQYANHLERDTGQQMQQVQLNFQPSSRIPLYVASLIAVAGGIFHASWLVGLGLTIWVYFFLNWLRRIESQLFRVSRQYQQWQQLQQRRDGTLPEQISQPLTRETTHKAAPPTDLLGQIQQWLYQGNPVLKIAILVLVIGLILLLRFAVDHWELSLAFKLALVACISAVVVALGQYLLTRNRGFGLALEGLGFAGMFLSLVFAYHFEVMTSLPWTCGVYFLLMAAVVGLSLRQQSVELAIMAMLVGYVAPFTLPGLTLDVLALLSYYLLVNVTVAFMSSLRPWKFLNQIAFVMTLAIGAGYGFVHGYVDDRFQLSALVLAHAGIFIWLSHRYSQLVAIQDLQKFQLKPILDSALLFAAPLLAYGLIYLMYLDEQSIKLYLSLGFAGLYGLLWQLGRRSQTGNFLAQSYLSLSLIFLSFIPPILLPNEWSVIGWVTEALLILILALQRQSLMARYVSLGMLAMGGFSALYYLIELPGLHDLVQWSLALGYLAAIVLINTQKEIQPSSKMKETLVLCGLAFISSVVLMIQWLDVWSKPYHLVATVLSLSVLYTVLNEVLSGSRKAAHRQQVWNWLLPKWAGLLPVMLLSFIAVADHYQQGSIVWSNNQQVLFYAIANILLAWTWYRPVRQQKVEQEWVSFNVLLALAFASVCLIPVMPYISVVILPLSWCAWSYVRGEQAGKNYIWQSNSTLILMLVWMISSQLFSSQPFYGYVMPILNPFDLVSLGMLAGLVWILLSRAQHGLERGLVSVLMLLSVLWLSSYVLLRALHVYFATPYNEITLWQDSLVQLNLTLLWVVIAFVVMSLSVRRQIRALWMFGASILALVTLKLVLLDLSHIGTLNRVFSFLGAGMVMLVIAYIAPMPQTRPEQKDSVK